VRLHRELIWGLQLTSIYLIWKYLGIDSQNSGSMLPPTKRVSNQEGPRPHWRGRSADENDVAVVTRLATSLSRRRLGPDEEAGLSAATASRWRRRRSTAPRRERCGCCRRAPPPPVPTADAQLPEPPDPLPSHRPSPSGEGSP